MTTSYHHGNLREALLDAVGEIIDEKGLVAVSGREAARRAGVSHGAPAHHFGDKVGMLRAYALRGFALFHDRMQAAADSADDPAEKFIAIGIEYVRFALEQRSYFEVMFRSEFHDQDDDESRAVTHAGFAVLAKVIGDAGLHGSGQLTEQERLIASLSAWATVHGLATLWKDGLIGQFWDGDDLVELTLAIFGTDANGEGPRS